MTKLSIIERMKTPSDMRPLEVMESYAFLAAIMAEEGEHLAEIDSRLAGVEALYIQDGKTSSAARSLIRGSELGKEHLMLRASYKASEELIRALKKMQQYHADAANNKF